MGGGGYLHGSPHCFYAGRLAACFGLRSETRTINLTMAMIHYTLNTGDSRVSQRSEVADAAIATLRPLLARGGQLPPPFSGYRVEVSHAPGGAIFSVHRGAHPTVLCAVSRDPATADRMWSEIEGVYLQLVDNTQHVAPGKLAERPESTPWLAVVVLPTIILESRSDIGWLGDFERCFAWTLIEA